MTTAPTTQQVSRQTLASMLLRDLNAPDNTLTNAAVVTWLNHESGNNIVGNNPLNIHYDNAVAYGLNPSGKWYSSGDGTYVASFSSLEAGMAATAKFLTSLGRYAPSVASLRANDPVGFLNNIARSGWSECQYGLVTNAQDSRCHGDGVTNTLIGQYHNLIGNLPSTTPSGGGSGSPPGSLGPMGPTGPTGSGTTATTLAGAIANFLGVSSSSNLTSDQVSKLVNEILKSADPALNLDPTGTAHAAAATALTDLFAPYVGKPISTIPDNLGSNLGIDIGAALHAYASTTGTAQGLTVFQTNLLPFLQWLGDPAHWLYLLTTALGVAMMGYGVITLTHAYGGEPQGVQA